MSDPLCVCGHLADHHADPAIGDTRCLVVEDRRDLLDVFDDGRDGPLSYCGCLTYRPGRPAHNEEQAS